MNILKTGYQQIVRDYRRRRWGRLLGVFGGSLLSVAAQFLVGYFVEPLPLKLATSLFLVGAQVFICWALTSDPLE